MRPSCVIAYFLLAGTCFITPFLFISSRLSPAARLSSAISSTATTISMADVPTGLAPWCSASGYCSLETQPRLYVGPLRSNLELKAALRALAFRKEIILTTESRVDPAAQFLSQFQNAGYGHVLVMTDSRPLCKHLATLFKQLGCGWSPDPSLYDQALSIMFQLKTQYPKLFMAARIIRHGYNVMITDSDMVILSDFYIHLKQPPLADVQLIVNSEGNNSLTLNGGWFYVQNASPSGPIAWAFADATIRSARLMMDSTGIQALGVPEWYCYDQAGMNDVVYSTIIGRPCFQSCLTVSDNHQLGQAWQDIWENLTKSATQRMGLEKKLQSQSIPVSPVNRDIVGGLSYKLYKATLRLPHIYGGRDPVFRGWPDAFGGKVFGSGRIPLSVMQMVHEFLVKDVDAPLWPDLEHPATAAAAAKQPTESLAFAPWWLVGTYQASGWLGNWNSKLTKLPMTVIGHMWAGFPPGKMQKRAFLSCSNLFDYKLAAQVHKHKSCIYPGCPHGGDTKFSVLAYAPKMFNHMTTLDQYAAAVADLGRLAIAMKRVIGLPGAPLSAKWTHGAGRIGEGYGVDGKHHVVPWTYVNKELFMAFQPTDSLEELSGVWSPMFCDGCTRIAKDRRIMSSVGARAFATIAALYHTRLRNTVHHEKTAHTFIGLLPMDLKHFVSTLAPKSSAPGSHNTFQVPKSMSSGPDRVIQIPRLLVLSEARRMKAEPIIWLTQFLTVGALSQAEQGLYSNLTEGCCALQFNAMKNKTHLPHCHRFQYML